MARTVLTILTLVAVVGLSVNMIWPPDSYGYESEQALLVVIGIAALLLSRHAADAAITLYCSLALLPVLAMMEYHREMQAGEWAKLAAVPFIGVFIVGFLTRNAWHVIGYTIVATGANCAIGSIYDDAGAAGALVAITIIAGTLLTTWCLIEARRDDEFQTLASTNENLKSETGELRGHLNDLDRIAEVCRADKRARRAGG